MKYLSILLLIILPAALPAQWEAKHIKYINGHWFNGTGFDPKDMYSANGFFTDAISGEPDTTIDLEGMYILPPFGEGHNHNLGTGSASLDTKAMAKYMAAGVFYVKIPGNLPVSAESRRILSAHHPNTIDVSFSQGVITSTGGWPIFIVENIHPRQGYNEGFTLEQLRDYRYFTINSEAELDQKWPTIMAQQPDFIKTFLWNSDDFERLRDDTTVSYKGLDPDLLPRIVAKAHHHGLRVSAHVTDAADFHHAVVAGVDEINHLPRYVKGTPNHPIAVEDAQLAAQKGIVVITTVAASLFQGGLVGEADRPLARQYQIQNLKLLAENGVTIAIGSDDINDTSVKEVLYLRALGVFDPLTLLNMWTKTTPQIIFPGRKIGELKAGYEASFLALGGNPLEDFTHVDNIKMRIKQGVPIAADVPGHE